MCIETFRNILGLTELGKPKDTKKTTSNDIFQLIAAVLGYYPNVKFFDDDYKTTTLEEYTRFIQYSKVNWLTYESEYFDCDDFAIALWGEFTKTKYWSGLAFGEISVHNKKTDGCHALNIFVTNDEAVYYCEPQNDSIFLLNSKPEYEPYYIMF